ncbi:hypothetical protein LINPERHAP2_LOCUS41475 [Linum perenne]
MICLRRWWCGLGFLTSLSTFTMGQVLQPLEILSGRWSRSTSPLKQQNEVNFLVWPLRLIFTSLFCPSYCWTEL